MELGLGVLSGGIGRELDRRWRRGRGGMEESAECGRRGGGDFGKGRNGEFELGDGAEQRGGGTRRRMGIRGRGWEDAAPSMDDGWKDGAPFRPGPETERALNRGAASPAS
jgi:hypothetical protein